MASRSAPSSSWRTGNRVTGTASHANIEVSPSGELIKADVLEGSDPISDARVSADRLRITTKSTDGSEDSNDFELHLLADNEAELRLVVPPDVPTPKPWKMTRVVAKP
jgi:hypothetical protein